MPRRPRRNHTRVFKSNIALAAIKGDKTVAELSQQFDVQAKLERLFRCLRSARQRRIPLISCRRTMIAPELLQNRFSYG